jgi:hypothetical protein
LTPADVAVPTDFELVIGPTELGLSIGTDITNFQVSGPLLESSSQSPGWNSLAEPLMS